MSIDNTGLPKDFLHFFLKRLIITLYKNFLFIFEDLQFTHKNRLEVLKKSIPEEYHKLIDNFDYFDDNVFSRSRKRILDFGNQCVRDMEEELEKYNTEFKK